MLIPNQRPTLLELRYGSIKSEGAEDQTVIELIRSMIATRL